MRADAQLPAWEFLKKRDARIADAVNGLGPFKQDTEERYRHPDCPNYDGCLSFAAIRRWASFSCKGCRKAVGTWEEVC